jgi:hypothetical protein
MVEDTELQKRVEKWLMESGPPDAMDPDTYTTEHRQHGAPQKLSFESNSRSKESPLCKNQQSPRHLNKFSTLPNSVLYHPDFLDWKACELAADNIRSGKKEDDLPANSSTPNFLRLFDNAHASLSMLVLTPFGELGGLPSEGVPE